MWYLIFWSNLTKDQWSEGDVDNHDYTYCHSPGTLLCNNQQDNYNVNILCLFCAYFVRFQAKRNQSSENNK